jgi:ABC-type multidrug transport system permease subunit
MSRHLRGLKIFNEINAVNQSVFLFGAFIYVFSPTICGIKTTFVLRLLKSTLQRFFVIPAT